jgi:hypothetical protein
MAIRRDHQQIAYIYTNEQWREKILTLYANRIIDIWRSDDAKSNRRADEQAILKVCNKVIVFYCWFLRWRKVCIFML